MTNPRRIGGGSSTIPRRFGFATGPSLALIPIAGVLIPLLGSWPSNRADAAETHTPFAHLVTVRGPVDYVLNGAPLAVDVDGDGRVDTPLSVATVELSVPPTATLEHAFLYWVGSHPDSGCTAGDASVTFQPPGAPSSEVAADGSICSAAGSGDREIWAFRSDVTDLLQEMTGSYSVGDFEATATGHALDNASFSIVVIFRSNELPRRSVHVHDGNLALQQATHRIHIPFEMIESEELGTRATRADLSFHVAEGDRSPSGGEHVVVNGESPSLGPLVLSDEINPPDNPMNSTINVAEPPRTAEIGTDIDRFDASAALHPADRFADVDFVAGLDRWWLVLAIFAVDEVNHAPQAAFRIGLIIDEDAPGTVNVVEPATDPNLPDDSISLLSVDAGGAAGEVTFTRAGEITFDPRGRYEALGAGDSVFEHLTYTLVDEHGATDAGDLRIEIVGRREATQIQAQPAEGTIEWGLADLDQPREPWVVAELTATLAAGSLSVAGRTVQMVVAQETVCSALTNAQGEATCTAQMSLERASFEDTWTAVFPGDDQFHSATDEGAFAVRGVGIPEIRPPF